MDKKPEGNALAAEIGTRAYGYLEEVRTMITWHEVSGGDLRGYLGGIRNRELFKIILDSEGTDHLLLCDLPGVSTAVYGSDIEVLKGKAEEMVSEFVRMAGLHCAGCDGRDE